MPNWCENTLVVTGDEGEIKRFKEKARVQNDINPTALSLNRLYPMPDEIRNTVSGGTIINGAYVKVWRVVNGAQVAISEEELAKLKEKYGATNWYDWATCHWGTKWDIEAELAYEDDNVLEYRFDTAWSPPVEWLQKVAADYPKLCFCLKYEEPGMAFMGVAVGENGKVTDNCLSY